VNVVILLGDSLGSEFYMPTSTVNQQMQLYNFHLKHFNTLKTELNPICNLLALLGAHHIFHVGRIRVKTLKNHFDIFRSFQIIIREFRRSLLKLLNIHDLVRFCKQGFVAAYHIV